jgi:hypothetical protein
VVVNKNLNLCFETWRYRISSSIMQIWLWHTKRLESTCKHSTETLLELTKSSWLHVHAYLNRNQIEYVIFNDASCCSSSQTLCKTYVQELQDIYIQQWSTEDTSAKETSPSKTTSFNLSTFFAYRIFIHMWHRKPIEILVEGIPSHNKNLSELEVCWNALFVRPAIT